MQTVNFNCTHCHKLMAVGLNLLGRNVRCPHCKQVVQAPSTPGYVSGKNLDRLPTPNHHTEQTAQEPEESIFEDAPGDDLFSAKSLPARSTRSAEPYHAPSTRTSALTDPPPIDSSPRTITRRAAPATQRNPAMTAEEEIAGTEGDEGERDSRRESRGAERAAAGTGIFTWMLLAYGLLTTGATAYLLYDRMESPQGTTAVKENPFSVIPDFFGQYDRAERKKVVKIDGLPTVRSALPANLKVRLNETLAVGDLEVTPLEVQYGRVTRYRKVAGQPAEVWARNPDPTLFVMRLKVKNLSEDTSFCPNDPAFTRRKESPPTDVPPYSGLVIGQKFHPGGAFLWPDPDGAYEYEFIDGQEDDGKPLAPGEERTICVPADMDVTTLKSALDTARQKKQPVEWRVQLRRGLVQAKDPAGVAQDVSVSAVIGVTLDPADFSY